MKEWAPGHFSSFGNRAKQAKEFKPFGVAFELISSLAYDLFFDLAHHSTHNE